MRFLSAFLIAILLSTNACAWPHGGAPASVKTPTPGVYFRSNVGGTYSTNYNWYGSQVVAPTNAVVSSSPSRFSTGTTVHWTILPTDNPLSSATTRRDEFLFAYKGSPGYDVTAYGYYNCIAMSVFLPSGWQDSVQPVSMVTNNTTASGNPTVHVAGTGGNIGTNCPAGSDIVDATAPTAIPAHTYVLSRTASTVTMNNNAAGAGIGSGDTINCGSAWFFVNQLHADELPTLQTNDVTASGSAIVNFAGTTGNDGTVCPVGGYINDQTTPSAIPASTTILVKTKTAITMSANAAGPGIGSGDVIQCGSNPVQAAYALNVYMGHLYMPIWGGYASLGYSASKTNIDLGAYVTNQWMDVESCYTYQPGTGVTGGVNGTVQVWTRTCNAGVAAPSPAQCPAALQSLQISATNAGGAITCYDGSWNSVACTFTNGAQVSMPTAWAQADGSITPMYYKQGAYENYQPGVTHDYYAGPFVLGGKFSDSALSAFGQYP